MPAGQRCSADLPGRRGVEAGASSLQYAELAVVTVGWVVVLQVGLVLVDRFRYAVELPPAEWLAMVVALAAQAYLPLGPSGAAEAPA